MLYHNAYVVDVSFILHLLGDAAPPLIATSTALKVHFLGRRKIGILRSNFIGQLGWRNVWLYTAEILLKLMQLVWQLKSFWLI